MKFLKHAKLVAGSALMVTGLTLLGIWCFRTPSREITRAELDQFVQAKTLTDGRVVPTSYAGILPDEDQHLQSRQFLLEELLVLMGGRAAERTFYGATTNGAAGDLKVARKIARKLIHEWGKGEKLYYEPEQHDAEAEINRLLETADHRAHELIQAQKANTEKLAEALLDRETLTKDEVLQLLTPASAGAPAGEVPA